MPQRNVQEGKCFLLDWSSLRELEDRFTTHDGRSRQVGIEERNRWGIDLKIIFFSISKVFLSTDKVTHACRKFTNNNNTFGRIPIGGICEKGQMIHKPFLVVGEMASFAHCTTGPYHLWAFPNPTLLVNLG